MSEPAGSAFSDRAEGADGERCAEDAQIVVVDLVAQPGVADLVEALELVEADGIAVRHEQAMEHDGEACLAEGVDLFRFAENFDPAGTARAGGRSNRRRLTAGTRRALQSLRRGG